MEEFRPGTITAPAAVAAAIKPSKRRQRGGRERERAAARAAAFLLPPSSSSLAQRRRRRRCLRVSLLGRCSLVREDRPRRKERKERGRENQVYIYSQYISSSKYLTGSLFYLPWGNPNSEFTFELILGSLCHFYPCMIFREQTRRKCPSRTCSGNASNAHLGMFQI